jgi:hypothetical protein
MFAKLFSSITESSLWSEPKEVRLLFVTMLAKADQTGLVEASLPGLARVANLSLDETITALQILQAPDPYSKNPDNEGRRVLQVPRGFVLLNYEDYRARRNTEERQEYMRSYMKEYRKQRKQSVNTSKQPLADVIHSEPQLAQAEAEAEAEAKKNKTSKKKALPSRPDDVPQDVWDDFLAIRKAKRLPLTQTAMEGIRREAAKAGWDLERVIRKCCTRGWASFDSAWLDSSDVPQESRVATAADFGEGGYRP